MTLIQPLELATPLRMLVVDDEPDMLDLLARALTSLGHYDVELAISADEALEKISGAEARFDIFLLDIQMPEMGGVELLGAIRALPDYAETPVIMLTAMGDREYVEAAFREGAHDYVTKPFDYDDLLFRIDAVCGPEASARKADGRRAGGAGRFGDIHRLIGLFEFNNYIAQLAHGRLFDARLFAVRLRRPQDVEPDSRGAPSDNPIASLAKAISLFTASDGCLFCLYGSETFLVLSFAEEGSDPLLQEHELNRIFQSALSNGALMQGYQALVGDPVSMRSLSEADIVTALEEAVCSVERRAQSAAERAPLKPADAVRPARPKRTSRAIYDHVVHELFGARGPRGGSR
jgi:CheY-like chemotaxis protein